MKDNLFRGFSIETCEWVYGYLVKAKHYLSGAEATMIVELDSTPYTNSIYYPTVVDPVTVSQYIGAVDANGERIFEGDILKCSCCGEIRTVEYDKDFLQYEFSSKDPVENPDGLALCVDSDRCEIIGNIWEDAYLLKGD